MPPTPALTCDLTAIDVEFREQHMMTIKHLFSLVQVVHELSDGYAFRLPNDSETFLQAAKFVEHERRCCPFNFMLELKAADGPFWLKLTGPEGIKQLLQAEFGHYVNGWGW